MRGRAGSVCDTRCTRARARPTGASLNINITKYIYIYIYIYTHIHTYDIVSTIVHVYIVLVIHIQHIHNIYIYIYIYMCISRVIRPIRRRGGARTRARSGAFISSASSFRCSFRGETRLQPYRVWGHSPWAPSSRAPHPWSRCTRIRTLGTEETWASSGAGERERDNIYHVYTHVTCVSIALLQFILTTCNPLHQTWRPQSRVWSKSREESEFDVFRACDLRSLLM